MKITPFFQNQLLLATPLLQGSCFQHAVIFVCAHDEQGAMGIIINHKIENLTQRDLFKQFSLPEGDLRVDMPVFFGGPVDMQRGFIIHTYEGSPPKDSLLCENNIAVNSSIDLLRDIASGNRPKHSLLALGYAGWAAGQLEKEIEENSWITVPATLDLIFSNANEDKWEKASQAHGIDLHKLSIHSGHA